MSEILDFLTRLCDTQEDEVHRWFAARRKVAAPFLTTSVDLRHSGRRLVPVDTNLFPAGFNNMSPAAMRRGVRAVQDYFRVHAPSAKKLLVIPENHTRNMFYLENLVSLMTIFSAAGLEVSLGSLAAAPGEPVVLSTPSGVRLEQFALSQKNGRLVADNGFIPDAVVLNNDLTSGMPEVLENIAQPIFPPPSLGWWRRRKSMHFAAYEKLAADFCKEFSIDPWLISALFHKCGMIDFRTSEGLDCLAKGVDCVLEEVRRKYAQYGIMDEPYVYVKADSGTYGMGIMTVRSGSEMLELNKKERNKMQVIKEGTLNTEVIIQEGIPTIDRVDGNPAEPLIYLIDGEPIGGVYRVNANRDALGNLNASGMVFTGMCDEEENLNEKVAVRGCHQKALGLIAALAALAAPREECVSALATVKLCAEA